MLHPLRNSFVLALVAAVVACGPAYKPQPVPFRLPSRYANVQDIGGAQIAAEAFADRAKAREAFGFDVHGAGLFPVQVVFDNRSDIALRIDAGQTFLEDGEGNLWPILQSDFAYERVTRYVETNQMFREGAYRGAMGAVAGAVIGAAVGVVTGEDVGTATGKGAAVGAGAGILVGGGEGAAETGDAKARVMKDFKDKSLKNKSIPPNMLAYGFLFFPGEADSARELRLQLEDAESGRFHTVHFGL